MSLATLATRHLDLVPLGPAHGALYIALYTDPRVMARIGTPLDIDAARRAFGVAVRANVRAPAQRRTWAIIERGGARPLGIAALMRREADSEMGLMLRPAGWNALYSHEAIDALVAHAFDDLGITRLTGFCQAGHAERMSRRLLEPHGFVEAASDRPGSACRALDRGAWTRPVGSAPGAG